MARAARAAGVTRIVAAAFQNETDPALAELIDGIAKETSRLDIGQTVVVKGGTVLAVEAFEGTNAAMKRGGELGRKDAVMVKVSKPNQDFRFDVPVIGPLTLEAARDARIRVLAVEAGRTLLLEKERLIKLAGEHRVSIFGINP